MSEYFRLLYMSVRLAWKPLAFLWGAGEPREDPAESEANEEASQLPAGKRVVPEQAHALIT
ncbi:hypothetical protein N780_02545 [Pontibacillus chungwhensis BH030062]|uniref:Uncharacterized protein n=1 Tax=Pontibacillus chungwhensis BH030062 TaxID=1385513 RepID=A0A0A2VBA9_9BACI|nr:hypothetical protein N780_02545 [Pontibacillus chungwhensis BH030062]